MSEPTTILDEWNGKKSFLKLTFPYLVAASAPLDLRTVVDNANELATLINTACVYDGMRVWVKSEGQLYVCRQNGNSYEFKPYQVNSAESVDHLKETHNIQGHGFNGTQDVESGFIYPEPIVIPNGSTIDDILAKTTCLKNSEADRPTLRCGFYYWQDTAIGKYVALTVQRIGAETMEDVTTTVNNEVTTLRIDKSTYKYTQTAFNNGVLAIQYAISAYSATTDDQTGETTHTRTVEWITAPARLSDATNGTDDTTSGVAATPKAVKEVKDYAVDELAKKADLTDLAAAFDEAQTYAVGDYVTKDGDLYRCKAAFPPSKNSFLTLVTTGVGDSVGIKHASSNDNIPNCISGDYLILGGKLYRCDVAFPPTFAACFELREINPNSGTNGDQTIPEPWKGLLPPLPDHWYFDSNERYEVGQHIIKDGNLYQCVVDYNPHFDECFSLVGNVKEFNAESFAVGDYVYVPNGEQGFVAGLYRCTEAYPPQFSTVYFQPTTVADELAKLPEKADLTDLAPAWNSENMYSKGDYVTKDGDLYRCKQNIAANVDWNANNFVKVAVGAELQAKAPASAITSMQNNLDADYEYRNMQMKSIGVGKIYRASYSGNAQGGAFSVVWEITPEAIKLGDIVIIKYLTAQIQRAPKFLKLGDTYYEISTGDLAANTTVEYYCSKEPTNSTTENAGTLTTNTVNARLKDVESRLTTATSTLTRLGKIPIGMIVMWSGDDVPTGWALCDGTNNTPDLSGRFIVCAGTSTVKTKQQTQSFAGETGQITFDGKGDRYYQGLTFSNETIAELNNHLPYYALAFIMFKG